MLDNIYYVSSTNKTIYFNKNGVAVTALSDLHDYEWKYSEVYEKISSFSRETTDYELEIATYGTNARQKAQDIYDVLNADVLLGNPGKLYIGDYYMTGYFYGSKKAHYELKNATQMTLSFVSDEPYWTKAETNYYRTTSEETGEGFGYPYDFPYDYASRISDKSIYCSAVVPQDMIITIYGSASTCDLIIGGHEYAVSKALLTGETLTINTKEKTIIHKNRIGEKTNCFSMRNKDSYIFQKLAVGQNSIVSSYASNFDIVVLYERSEPAWT